MSGGDNNEPRTDYTGLIVGVTLLPLLIAFIYLGEEDRGRSLCVCLAAVVIAIRIRWDLKRHWWFWGIGVGTLAASLPAILVVKWPKGWTPGIAALPVAAAEFLLTLGAIRLAERMNGWLNPSSDNDSK